MPYDVMIDFETRSEDDIDNGQWHYWAHPTTEILCCGVSTRPEGGRWAPADMVLFEPGEHGFEAIEAVAREEGFTGQFLRVADLLDLLAGARRVVAHNFGFERAGVICKFPVLHIPIDRWSCTAARARRLGLPGKLKHVLALLEIGAKDNVGNLVMMQCTKPRPAWKKSGTGRKWFDDAKRLGRVAYYCYSDIEEQCKLDDFLPELDEVERSRWLDVQRRNDEGLPIDKVYLDNSIAIVEWHNAYVTEQIKAATGGAVDNLNAVASVLQYVNRLGCPIPSLGRDEITKMLERPEILPPLAVQVLQARLEVTKASTKKLYSARSRLMSDGTVKDTVIYFGAHTGRDTGSGFQPLNLPRPDDVVAMDARDAIKALDLDKLARCITKDAGKRKPGSVAGVTTYRGPKFAVSPSEAVAESLRTAIEAPRGMKLVAGDYARQELANTFWIAGQTDALKDMAEGVDLYCDLAALIYGHPIDKHEHPNQRQLGKQGVLGGGFGLRNALTFIATAAKYGIGLTEEVSQKTIDAYSKRFPKVPKSWSMLMDCVVAAMQNPMQWYTFRDILHYRFDGNWLVCVLPNGSWRYYPKPKLEERPGRRGKYYSVSYASVYQGQLCRSSLHGGLILENAAQPMGREWMEEDRARVTAETGWKSFLTVYDEAVFAVPAHENNAQKIVEEIMSRPKAWAPGLIIPVDTWEGDTYRKG